MNDQNDPKERLGRLIDELDNLRHAMQIPVEPKVHLKCLNAALPEKIEALKSVYVQIFNEDPWDILPIFGINSLPPVNLN